MPRPVGKPILGAAIGAASGAIAVLILQQGGIVPPTRLVLFGILGVAASAGSLLLTVTFRRPAPIVVQGACVAAVAFALTGIPAMSHHGNLSEPCEATATSSLPDTASPADTSVSDPFDLDSEGTLDYRVTVPGGLSDWSYSASLDVGGFPLVIWADHFPDETFGPVYEGTQDIGEDVQTIEDITGLRITGVYHVTGWVAGDEGRCDVDAYVRLKPPNLFSGAILVGLWAAAAFAALIAGVYGAQMAQLRRGARAADRAG